MKEWLDIIITGVQVNGLAAILDRLLANYENAAIYEIGAPSDGINNAVTEYAFQTMSPLTLGCPEDEAHLQAHFTTGENKAVLIFRNGHETKAEMQNIETAMRIAKNTGAQLKMIRVKN